MITIVLSSTFGSVSLFMDSSSFDIKTFVTFLHKGTLGYSVIRVIRILLLTTTLSKRLAC